MIAPAFRSMLVFLALGSVTTAAYAGDDWKPADPRLLTRWGEALKPDLPLPEHPRPQMVRDSWQNLNGLWDYAITGNSAARPSSFDGQILVPFAIESALSGVGKTVGPDKRLWYRRTFKLAAPNAGGRTWLRFGAVDWDTTVWVNGKRLGDHRGGYDPFSFDITDVLRTDGEQEVVVSVWDPTDAGTQPRGKQVREPHGIWYTAVTGIWQTVWIEHTPDVAIERLIITTDALADRVTITAEAAGEKAPSDAAVEYTVLSGGAEVTTARGALGKPVEIAIPNARDWSPSDPFLYDLRVRLLVGGEEKDAVSSYFGLRTVAVAKDSGGVHRLVLNGKPLFQYGPLDQGWWPDGLYTAPSDAALRYDVEVTKQMGFNMIRKHVKVEPARWYYHCDKLGLLVWQDMPSGDRGPRWSPNGQYDGQEVERSAESAAQFRQELGAMIALLRNHPSIVMWVPFNEAWGQFDTVATSRWVKQQDPTRLVNCASGGNDFPVGDVYDVHNYPGPYCPPARRDRATVLGEFGGLGLPLPEHTWQDEKNWGYRSFASKPELEKAYLDLVAQLPMMIGEGLAAAVYTQTTDVEVEVNGLMTYDRKVMKIDSATLAEAHRKLYEPPPAVTPVLASSRHTGQRWRYTTERPSGEWHAVAFDDRRWSDGEGGFGTKGTPGAVVRTEWKTPEIWLRRTFDQLGEPRGELFWSIHHDEDVVVYLNGTRVLELSGYTTGYRLVPFSAEARSALKLGQNVLAVQCRQTGGGQYIDLGLVSVGSGK